MRISVRQRGGLLGLDREIETDGAVVRVTEHGRSWYGRSPDSAQRDHIRDLATAVSRISDRVVATYGDLPSDSMATAIAIESDGERKRMTLRSGDSAPEPVWDLIAVLEELSTAE
jgi:hypothetical protein